MLTRRFLLSTVLALAPVPTARAVLTYSRLVVFGAGLFDWCRWDPLTDFRYPPSAKAA